MKPEHEKKTEKEKENWFLKIKIKTGSKSLFTAKSKRAGITTRSLYLLTH
jgi:hypothetical protein